MDNRVRIAIVGTGKFYQKYINRFNDCNVIALFDNATKKQGSILDDLRIEPVERIINYSYEYVVVLVNDSEKIVDQLTELGVKEDKIITCNPSGKFSEFRKVESLFSNAQNADVLLISHEMNLRGAPLMLYELGVILKGVNISIEVASTQKGDLLQYYKNKDINVLNYDDFIFSDTEIINYFSKYKLVIVNTLALSSLVNDLVNANINVTWWLHEEWSAYDILKPSSSYDWKKNNLSIYAVGNRAINAFYDFYGRNKIVENFQWGITEKCIGYTKPHDKVIFAIIGEVIYIKGQDLLVDISNSLDEEFLNKVEFWVIGKINKYEQEKLSALTNVKVLGEIDHNDLMELYSNIDVVLSLSRNDTMPVVLVEGMMKKKIIVTSTGTGVADYIDNHVNGIVFQSENIMQLCDEIRWILDNENMWDVLRNNAFQLYLNCFSVEHFKEEVKEKIIIPFRLGVV